jgi:hypothetical protein
MNVWKLHYALTFYKIYPYIVFEVILKEKSALFSALLKKLENSSIQAFLLLPVQVLPQVLAQILTQIPARLVPQVPELLVLLFSLP